MMAYGLRFNYSRVGLKRIKQMLFEYLDAKTNEYSNGLLGGSTGRNCIIVVLILCKQALYTKQPLCTIVHYLNTT